MNSMNKNFSSIISNKSLINMQCFNKLSSNSVKSSSVLNFTLYNKSILKFFARTTAGSKAELEKKWRDQLEGFKQNWRKVKDDNFEQ